MTLVVSVFVPTGIVLAADSRTTIQSTATRQVSTGVETIQTPLVLSDSAFKVHALPSSGVGILTYGEAFAAELPVDSHLRQFAEQFDRPEHDVPQMAELLEHGAQSYTSATVGQLGVGNLYGSPGFVAAAWGSAGDYHLLPGSVALNAGTAQGAPTDDLDRNWRDATPDVGAYELVGGARRIHLPMLLKRT